MGRREPRRAATMPASAEIETQAAQETQETRRPERRSRTPRLALPEMEPERRRRTAARRRTGRERRGKVWEWDAVPKAPRTEQNGKTRRQAAVEWAAERNPRPAPEAGALVTGQRRTDREPDAAAIPAVRTQGAAVTQAELPRAAIPLRRVRKNRAAASPRRSQMRRRERRNRLPDATRRRVPSRRAVSRLPRARNRRVHSPPRRVLNRRAASRPRISRKPGRKDSGDKSNPKGDGSSSGGAKTGGRR